jgi:hypothetical protein
LVHADVIDAFVEEVVEATITGPFYERADWATIGVQRVAQVDELHPLGGGFVPVCFHHHVQQKAPTDVSSVGVISPQWANLPANSIAAWF